MKKANCKPQLWKSQMLQQLQARIQVSTYVFGGDIRGSPRVKPLV